MNGEATRFKIGNKEAEKWTEEEAIKMFELMYESAQTDNSVLSLQDAYFAVPIRTSTFYYLINKFPVLEVYKKDLADIVTSRINKKALNGDFNPAASIWRMKQLGERDTQYQEVENRNVNYNTEVTKEEAKEISDALEDEV